MKLVAFGVEPVGVVAIGANATGVVAIGQLATGVVAIGQLARGVVVVGQLAVGVVAFGQLALGVLWAGGMLGVAATSGPGLVAGLFGRFRLRPHMGGRTGPAFEPGGVARARPGLARLLLLLLIALWWLAVGQWVVDAITRPGGIFEEAPPPPAPPKPPLPCEPLC